MPTLYKMRKSVDDYLDALPYLQLTSPSNFTIQSATGSGEDDPIHIDAGTLEYSTDNVNWVEWNGLPAVSSVNGNLYLRGSGITTFNSDIYYTTHLKITGTEVSFIGSIEALLDHETVSNHKHPRMGDAAFSYLFSGNNNSIVNTPDFTPTKLTRQCYQGMFENCWALREASDLPATTLADYCYENMFSACYALVTVPDILPATKLATMCYGSMFAYCDHLTSGPELPATTLTQSCYSNMFTGCHALTQAPALPAAKMERQCYYYMFQECTSLVEGPVMPSTIKFAEDCCHSMFDNCTSLESISPFTMTTAPANCAEKMLYQCRALKSIPIIFAATEVGKECFKQMCFNCQLVTELPDLPATILAMNCYDHMFERCRAATKIPELPATTLVSGCYNYMFSSCVGIKVSETSDSEYTHEYTFGAIPSKTYASDMFYGTGGTFTKTPTKQTYYLSY